MERVRTNNWILILATLLCPPIGLVLALLCLYKSNENWKVCVFCIAYAMAIFAYCYQPTVDSDLVRYREIIDQIKNKSFWDAVNSGIYGEGNLYVFMALCWILGRIGQPNLLQATSVFLVFLIAGYINYKIATDNDVSHKESFASLVFLLLNASFYNLTNNVRNVLAFVIIFYAFFRDVYLKKKDIFTVVLYIGPCFMHASAILLVLFRFIASITGRIKWVLLILIIMMKTVVEYLSSVFSTLGGSNIVLQLIRSMLSKGNRYYNNYDSAWAVTAYNSGSMRLMKILVVLECIVITIFIFRRSALYKSEIIQGKITSDSAERMKLVDYLFLVDIMGFACVPMHMPEYWRFLVVVILFNGVILLETEFDKMKTSFIHHLRYGLFAITPIYFALCVRDLILYSKPLSMIINAFLCNPIIIFLNGNSEIIDNLFW